MTLPPCADAFTNTAVKLRKDGLSWVQIAREMDRRGIPCPNRNSWNADGVQRIVEGVGPVSRRIPCDTERAEVQRMRGAGMSITKIARAMAEAGYQTPKGGPWTPQTIQRMLRP